MEKVISRKKTPPEYGEPEGPMMVETHSKRLSPLGPAEQLHGGSKLISASSFWILYETPPPPREQYVSGLLCCSGCHSQ
jgi:hypothetical protein